MTEGRKMSQQHAVLIPLEDVQALITHLDTGRALTKTQRADLAELLQELMTRRYGETPAAEGTAPQAVNMPGKFPHARQQPVITYRCICVHCGEEFQHTRPAGRPRTVCDDCLTNGRYTQAKAERRRKQRADARQKPGAAPE